MKIAENTHAARKALREASVLVITALNRMNDLESQVASLNKVLGTNTNMRKAASHRHPTKIARPSVHDFDTGMSADVSTVMHRKPKKGMKRAGKTSKNADKIRALLADGRPHTAWEAREAGIAAPSVYYNNEVVAGRAKKVGTATFQKV